MKFSIIVFFILVTISSNGQVDLFNKYLGRSVAKFNIPNDIGKDSCYYSNALLNITLDENSKVSNIEFSDNAEPWLTNELDTTKKNFDINIIEKHALKSNFKNCKVLIPVLIRGSSASCDPIKKNSWFNPNYFKFNGQNLLGNCFFLNPVEIYFYPPSH